MRLFLTAGLLLLGLLCRAQQPPLDTILRQHHVPGLQLVHTRGRTTQAYALGLRRSGTTQTVDANTIFQAASLSKVVLAYAALRLHDRGLLDLDRSLLSYGPYPRLATEPRAARLTARLVLTHCAGLPNWADNPLAPGWATSPLRLKYAPDSCWNYSGEGFVLLQRTLEHISGQPWQQLAQTEVFKPLGLRRSSFVWQPAFATNASYGHDAAGQPTEIRQFGQANAAFSLLTTATDYGRFVQALLRGRGLKPATARLLHTPATPADRCGTPVSPTDAHISWACGVGLVETSRGPALWHWGDNGDFKNLFLAFPATGESVVLLTNGENGLRAAADLLPLLLGPGDYWVLQWLREQ